MKKGILLLLITMMALPITAQNNTLWNDGISVGVSYGFNLGKRNLYNDYAYKSATVTAGYRKFLYKGFFVMPELSLNYQQYNNHISWDANNIYSSQKLPEKGKLNRAGIGIDALVGIRIPIVEKVGIDLMTGPYGGYSFVNNADEYFPSGNLYEFEFRWRFGLGISIFDKYSITATYDLIRPELGTGILEFYKRRDIFSIGVGYTF